MSSLPEQSRIDLVRRVAFWRDSFRGHFRYVSILHPGTQLDEQINQQPHIVDQHYEVAVVDWGSSILGCPCSAYVSSRYPAPRVTMHRFRRLLLTLDRLCKPGFDTLDAYRNRSWKDGLTRFSRILYSDMRFMKCVPFHESVA